MVRHEEEYHGNGDTAEDHSYQHQQFREHTVPLPPFALQVKPQPMDWFLFILGSFATYRISEIIAEEEGPLSVFRVLRRKVPAKTNAGRGIRCPYCVGVWIAGLVTGYLWWLGLVPLELTPIWLFGVSGLSAVIESWFK